MTIFEKLLKARKEFLNSGTTKSGKTSMYEYFTLDDIVPKATLAFEHNGLVFVANKFNATENTASATLYDVEDGTSIEFVTNFPSDAQLRGQNAYQMLGSGITYCRRYLYMMCLDIVEYDKLESEIAEIAELQKKCKDKYKAFKNSEKCTEQLKTQVLDLSKENTIPSLTKAIELMG